MLQLQRVRPFLLGMSLCTAGRKTRRKTWPRSRTLQRQRGRRGGRRGGGQQNPQGNPAHAALIASGSDGPAPELQQGQVPPSVPGPNPQGAGQGN